MGKKYNNAISTSAGFKYNSPSPLDDRLTVETYADLVSDDFIKYVYDGMVVYVQNEDTHYKYNGSDWTEFGRIVDISMKANKNLILTYSISNGAITITKCSTTAAGLVIIPETIEGLPVTAIAYEAFKDCTGITEVRVPDTVSNFGSDAFRGCTALTTINIPKALTTLPIYTFYECSSLASIYIPKSLTSILADAFRNCTALTDVYYEGTEEDWSKIRIKTNNASIRKANRHYNQALINKAELKAELKTAISSLETKIQDTESSLVEDITEVANSKLSYEVVEALPDVISSSTNPITNTIFLVPNSTKTGYNEYLCVAASKSIYEPITKTGSAIAGLNYTYPNTRLMCDPNFSVTTKYIEETDTTYYRYSLKCFAVNVKNRWHKINTNFTYVVENDYDVEFEDLLYHTFKYDSSQRLAAVEVLLGDGTSGLDPAEDDLVFRGNITFTLLEPSYELLGPSDYVSQSELTAVKDRVNTIASIGLKRDFIRATSLPEPTKDTIDLNTIYMYQQTDSSGNPVDSSFYTEYMAVETSRNTVTSSNMTASEFTVNGQPIIDYLMVNNTLNVSDAKLVSYTQLEADDRWQESVCYWYGITLYSKENDLTLYIKTSEWNGVDSGSNSFMITTAMIQGMNKQDSYIYAINADISNITNDGTYWNFTGSIMEYYLKWEAVGTTKTELANYALKSVVEDSIDALETTKANKNQLLTYTISTTKKEVTITDCDASTINVVIPETIEGYPVTTLSASAFKDCTALASVILPDSLTKITRNGSFSGCTSLTSIVIPKNIAEITTKTFYNCTALSSVYIPKNVTKINSNAFFGCTVLADIYYEGSESDWNSIEILTTGNDSIKNATKHYNQEAVNKEYADSVLGQVTTYDTTQNLKELRLGASSTAINSGLHKISNRTGTAGITFDTNLTLESNADICIETSGKVVLTGETHYTPVTTYSLTSTGGSGNEIDYFYKVTGCSYTESSKAGTIYITPVNGSASASTLGFGYQASASSNFTGLAEGTIITLSHSAHMPDTTFELTVYSLEVSNTTITGLARPAIETDAANKAYVDDNATKIQFIIWEDDD